MNAITPAKLIPPDQSTAARGALPTEQTKLSTAMIGPTITFSIVLISGGASWMKRRVEEVVAQQADEAGEQEADRDLLPEHLPVAAEVVGDVGPGARRRQPLPPVPLRSRGRVDVVTCACLGVLARLLLQLRRDEAPQQDRHQRDQHDPADELGQRELPADQDPDAPGRAPRRGWSRRTGRRARSPPRRPSGTATSRSRSPRRSRTRRRRRGRWPSPAARSRCPRAPTRSARAAPRPGRSRRSRSRAPAPTRPPRPSGRTA